ncbi:MAG: hypothetical protein KBG48_17210 [Kofleriaceae bacterium]|nr:hypothetical protein [Kofleriaceae bacterium]MBP9169139.1 hypothetical protein [Kofleriaceae bacterium]MBP9857832.1 hypothetical protein [Kofleriaceae bacterium]
MRASRAALLAAALVLAAAGPGRADDADATDAAPPPAPTSPVERYFAELASLGLVDVDGGNQAGLKRDLAAAERLLRDGAAIEAAVALAAIVESPRYADFADFVEYQNAEYYLGVALHGAGAYGAALRAIERVLRRGPEAPYWGPAHRRAVDVALETRDFAGVLARIEALDGGATIPPSASGERAYLRGRAAYQADDLVAAEGQLATISKKSRLYSSALYLRGVIRTRKGQWKDAAEAMCEVAGTADSDRITFVVDERYFTIKDLARLGLGRIAHERAEYDDAYYHYFQIPSDSVHLPDALFEAAWSMYQKRELATARDLVAELRRAYPDAPTWPEAGLLGAYVELADCKFDDARSGYDRLVAELTPVVAELERIRKDPDARRALFDRALARWRDQAAGAAPPPPSADLTSRVLGLIRLDPGFVRLHDAVTGLRRAAGEAPGLARTWAALASRTRTDRVAAVAAETTVEQDDAAEAARLVDDLRALAEQVGAARRELDRGRAAKQVAAADADDEAARLTALAARVEAAGVKARALTEAADATTSAAAPAALRTLLDDDVRAARRLDRQAATLLASLEDAAAARSQAMIDRLYTQAKRVLDKARLGKVDAVIGQKRALDIKVQDLAAGRFPEELFGRMWEQGMIGDDEELWPFEGEYWADEYEGWR